MARAARMTFFTTWFLVPVVTSMDDFSLIVKLEEFPWYALRPTIAIVWTLAGGTWAAAEYRRRH